MVRIAAIAVVVVVSGWLAWLSEPLARQNNDLLVAAMTIFSVFGGFLVAVMSIGGEPLIAKTGNWRKIELGRDAAVNRMDRARLLFYAYLIASCLILIVLALQKSNDPTIIRVLWYVNYLCLWFTCMGILFSFALPSMLIGIQQARIEEEINRRKSPSPERGR